jgi:capsular exopolysaccharide synthesis family protein
MTAHSETQPGGGPVQRALQAPGGADLHRFDPVAALYRHHRHIAISVFALTSLAILIQWYSTVRIYEAKGRLLIETERAAIPARAQDYEDPELYYNTQYRNLKGREIARRVIQQLHLEAHPEFKGAAATTGTPAPPDEMSLIDGFLARLSVEPVQDSRFVEVTFRSIDPKLAALATNTLMDEYVGEDARARLGGEAVRVARRAEVPQAPIAPAGRATWLITLSFGLGLAVAIAFGLDYMNDTVKTPEDITGRLKLPFLGLVPMVHGVKHPLLASSHVPPEFGESCRALRTSLLSRSKEPGTKLLVVTSAQPLEGKTIAAVNIGMALAYGGCRVLLVDADMRRPGLHLPLRLTNERGLSQVLSGQARVRDVVQRTVDPNLLAITAGKTPPNPSELISSERMKALLRNLTHAAFDWILFDTPPVLAVTDAVVLAPSVAGVLYVIGAEMTRRRLAERAMETILSANPRSVAAVLNKVDFTRRSYYWRHGGRPYKNPHASPSLG